MATRFFTKISILSITASAILYSGAASAECDKKYTNNFTVSVKQITLLWRVKHDTDCTATIRSGKETVGAVTLHGFNVTKDPSHGTVTFSSLDDYTYKPNGGYEGKDHFTIKVSFDIDGTDGQTEFVVDVDVVGAL
jgi:hypothetical protein